MAEEVERKIGSLLGYIERQQEEEKERREQFKIVYVNSNLNEGAETMKQQCPQYKDGSFRTKGSKIEYRFSHNGTQKYVYGINKNECFEKRTEIIQQNNNNKKYHSITFKKWINKWFETYKKPYLKSSTIYVMENQIQKIINKLGDYFIEDLTKEILQEFLNEQETYSKKRHLKLILNASLDEALEQEKIEKNPARKLKLPKNETKHRRALTFEEQELIINNITIKKYKAVFKVLCCTGMRIGELMAIDWEQDIDYNNLRIHITKNKNILNGEITTPKTKSSIRYVPFLKEIIPDLKCIQKEQITYNSTKLFFERLYKKINISGITIHSFRHTFDSLCYHAKISDKQIQKILGHATIDMTLNVYTHLLSKGNSSLFEYIKMLKKRLDNE